MELSFDGLTKSGYFSFVQVFKENLADTIVKCDRLINRKNAEKCISYFLEACNIF